jgi:hypothetical protein
MSAVIFSEATDESTIRAALARVDQKVGAYIAANPNLRRIPHTKHPHTTGYSGSKLVWAVAEIDARQSHEEIFQSSNEVVHALKAKPDGLALPVLQGALPPLSSPSAETTWRQLLQSEAERNDDPADSESVHAYSQQPP